MAKLWGGRFSKETSRLVDEFNASISFDQRLWEFDIQGSIAHARMLAKCGIIPQSDADRIVEGLESIADDIRAGRVQFDVSAEDIHMNIEKLLHERIGEVAGRLHTARSRNDQIALDVRMYLKDRIRDIEQAARELQSTLVSISEDNVSTLMPGYTHLQHAQPVTLAHHLMAYFWMFQRDRERLADCYRRTDVMPLGSGALAGTSFPLDREFVAKQLGFAQISENSMDAVSDRDFVVEFLAACSILAMHMSRFAEEIIIWNTKEFGFVELDDSMATGSSLMPQKKNPDVAELIRAKTGRVYGHLMSLLTVLKGLPLAYNKDLQEDKEPLFDTADTVLNCLRMLRALLETTEFRKDAMAASLDGTFMTATDIADYLVRRGMPFRSAHEIVGRIVQYSVQNNKSLQELTPDELREFSSELASGGVEWGVEESVESRDIPGGTAPGRVREQIRKARSLLEKTLLP